MTHWQRQASGGVVQAPPRPATGPNPVHPAALLWEEFYRHASPEQQREMLSLAGRQGVLYTHQLPQTSNGSPDKGRPLLTRLIGGQVAHLPPLRTTPFTPHDCALDESQSEAVARALQTPDVCLIQGLPGTGKSRVVAEIVTQAGARGERVLLAAPTAAAIDRVLELVVGRDVLCPIRCLAPTERAEFLSPVSRSATLADRGRKLTEHTLPQARGEVEALEKRCQAHPHEKATWDRLRELTDQHGKLAAEKDELAQARSKLAGPMTLDAARLSPNDPFEAVALAHLQKADEARQRHEKSRSELTAQIESQRQEKEAAEKDLEALRPIGDALEHKRWWTGPYWQGFFQGGVVQRITGLADRAQKAQEALFGHQLRLDQLDQLRQAEQSQEDAALQKLVEAETARCQAALDHQVGDLERRFLDWRTQWDQAQNLLAFECSKPPEPTVAALDAAHEAWLAQCRLDGEKREFARQWAACLEQVAESFPARLIGLCNLTAATVAGLPGDPHFGDAVASSVTFDLLVLDGADQVSDVELHALTRRARRWVLVGPPPMFDGEEPAPARPVEPQRSAGPRGRGPIRRPPSSVARSGPYHKLWQNLHCDPRQLPSAWLQDEAGLCCRLRPVTAEQSQFLESEHLADRPDIELRILAMPRVEPVLAEIVFPPSMTIAQAKELIFKELEQLPVVASGRGLRWLDHDDRVVLRLADGESRDAVTVSLAPGVREMVVAHPGGAAHTWATCCVEFDRAAGWHREGAEQWVERHLGLRDSGRTVHLATPHRMHPDLASFLSDWLFAGGYRPLTRTSANGPSAFEFVAVPGPRDHGRSYDRSEPRPGVSRGGATTLTRTPAAAPKRGGAGLEVDLSDPRGRERLPVELSSGLPDRGFANLPEAQALVRSVEDLVADPAHRAGDREAPQVGVIALYPGQVELIRRLLQQSPAVKASGVAIKVDHPHGFRELECPVVLVSLTRSHTHRAVSFGEGPHTLLLALTRARSRLVLFGDPGTLGRRSQWDAAVDHLDEAASARERDVVAGLWDHLQATGLQSPPTYPREGSGA